VAFWSDADQVVRPSSARLSAPGLAATNVAVPGRSHLGICSDPELVVGVVAALLEAEQTGAALPAAGELAA
jgi:hypothetical protein